MKILVTGANGQLGQCIKELLPFNNQFNFEYVFYDHKTLDITNKNDVNETLSKIKPNVVINCAAYTNVDNAETEEGKKLCYKVNYDGTVNLMEVCSSIGAFLIHISTDFVFDGNDNKPYREALSYSKSLNNYGESKRQAEEFLFEKYYGENLIIRTSWLYSEYGKNFFTTMANRIIHEQPTNVVNDQIGCPTYAKDLAKFIFSIINFDLLNYEKGVSKNHMKGIINYCNKGSASWYDFAKHIELLLSPLYFGSETDTIHSCDTDTYVMISGKKMAARPRYSVMDGNFLITSHYWVSSLNRCVLAYLRNIKKEG